MTVIEKRVRGILAQARPLASKMSKQQLKAVVEDVFQLGWEEPYPAEPFVYQSSNGLRLNVRPEPRGQNVYWFAIKQLDGKRHKVYLAPAGMLEKDLLENAAKRISG